MDRSCLNYLSFCDEELVSLAQKGDRLAEDILIRRYRELVRIKSHPYFLKGGEKEDIIQEGLIGLCKAIKSFDDSKKASFRTFASICITRQILTAVNNSTRKKHGPLNHYISLNKPVYDDNFSSCNTLIETIFFEEKDPEQLLIFKEEISKMKKILFENLSKLELEVLELYLQGNDYKMIAVILERDAKSIDNALQRIKRKVEEIDISI